MPDSITVQHLPAGQPDAGMTIVSLPMTAHDRRRVRRLVEAPDGTRLALELATGTVLLPGQVLHRTATHAYVVGAALEEVLVARPRDVDEAARVGHLIGNLHRDIEARDGEVIALADAALADRLRRAGVPFAAETRAFQGRAPGEHAH
jgi:urease accessory protein